MMEPMIMALCVLKLCTLGIVSYIFCNLSAKKESNFQVPPPKDACAGVGGQPAGVWALCEST